MYPLGMGTYNNTSNMGGFKTWKGDGIYSNPVAITSGNIRPGTNKDMTNNVVYKHGLARPIKHYRKGTSVNVRGELNNSVKSSTSLSLVGQLIDRPGSFSVKQNTINTINEQTGSVLDCSKCTGQGLVVDYAPTTTVTDNPRQCTQTQQNCCNAQKNALRRVRPASTLLSKNYFTTLQQYRENRCQTYDQRSFNFYADAEKANDNMYIANCYPNAGNADNVESQLVIRSFELMIDNKLISAQEIDLFYDNNITSIPEFALYISQLQQNVSAAELFKRFISNPYSGMPASGPSSSRNCKLVVYKPSNPQFATEGGVSSSARTQKEIVTTVEKNKALNKKLKYDLIYINKSKGPTCNNNKIYLN